ncbi:MAG: hypothetical protein C7B45_08575 [Sulfobacillus acidophilus]|uniref:Uncharacterized protein n=1 Tax=Sulfobacillus acidophilus TaxID=53633 RepID=A0A2T2WII9_9FIRM|nr:MAG: hypothetical protein C7B45_08575 [Sulfobacillus acidophilus]
MQPGTRSRAARVSPGCEPCYAERLSHRFVWATAPWTTPHAAQNVACHPERLDQPLHWTKPRRIFVNSLSHLFYDQVPNGFLDHVFATIVRTRHHHYQILTKRPARMQAYPSDAHTLDRIAPHQRRAATAATGPSCLADILPHVWLGGSACRSRINGGSDRRMDHISEIQRVIASGQYQFPLDRYGNDPP